MNKFYFVAILAVLILAACQEKEKPIPMQAEVSSQVEIVGNKANIVRPNTMSLVIVRDTVADEKTDTIYNLITSLTLVLDSTFMADKMEEALQLQINDITFVPIDDTIADKLITFVRSEVGVTITIEFSGKAYRSKFLQLPNATDVLLTGFSFHELDPEAMADPKISKMLDSYARWLKTMKKDMDDNYGILPQKYVHQGLPEAYGLYQQLQAKETKMSPKQKERFSNLLRLHKSIDFPE